MNLAKAIEERVDKFAEAIGKHGDANHFVRAACGAIARSKGSRSDLTVCDEVSVLHAIMQIAELGLVPGPIQGEAYLLPFNDKDKKKKQVQVIPGYRGLLKLAHRSGKISKIWAEVVHANDTFRVVKGVDETIEHVPVIVGDAGDMVAVYAIAKFSDGTTQFEVMSREQVEAVRKRSKAATSGPWVSDFEEMARKTVLRRLCKFLPVSPDFDRAVEIDNAQYREPEYEVRPRKASLDDALPPAEPDTDVEPGPNAEVLDLENAKMESQP